MNKEKTMISRMSKIVARHSLLALCAIGLVCALASVAHAQTQAKQDAPPPSPSVGKAFDTPLLAATALICAAERYDVPAIMEIFGPGGKDLVSSADPVQDKNNASAFVAMARDKTSVALDPEDPARAILSVGRTEWPLPVPIVQEGGKWHFDVEEGRDEILFRRIGGNELDAIQICRGFVEAQREYASEVHDDSGINQYAQRIISTPGKRDGLCWKNPDGTPGGPISETVARAIEEGYSLAKGRAYHGYYFKVLKGQGPAAPLGELDYVIKGMMIGGFALVAVPAEYCVTGVKTFMISHDGIVYQKDLGPDSLEIAKKMDRYNPDETWQSTDDQWPTEDPAVEN